MAGRTLCVFAVARLVNWPVEGTPDTRAHVAFAREGYPGEMNTLLTSIRTHRAQCDGVVVSFHGGVEYHSEPEPAERRFAATVAEAGADVVIGHHTHTPQAVEMLATRRGAFVPVFYSLGNLVSGQGSLAERGIDPFALPFWQRPLDPRVREGLIAVVRFVATPQGRLRVQHAGALPVWTVNTTDAASRRAHGGAPRITATVMRLPRDSVPGSLLYRRFNAITYLIGQRQVIRRADVPGVHEAEELSRAARSTATAVHASR